MLRKKSLSQKIPKTSQEEIVKAVHFIYENFGNPELNAREIAGHLKMKEEDFRSLFRKMMGTTPTKFLAEVRVQKSKTFLEKDTISMAEIARNTGFRNYDCFRMYFLKLVGMPPHDFRQMMNYKRVIEMKRE